MQEWNDFQPVGKWTATVTLVKDGHIVSQLDLADVEVLETGLGDLDPETGLPVETPLRLLVSGIVTTSVDEK